MLIQALSEYYDILAKEGKVVSDAYSAVNVNYIVCLTEDGRIDHLIECDKNTVAVLPKKSEKSTICANVVEYRPLYLFGLNYEKGVFAVEDEKNKTKKSHEDFVKKTLMFLEGVDTPVVNAFRNFVLTWKPEEETKNRCLCSLDKKYSNAKYTFCLAGQVDQPLHKDKLLLQKWEALYKKMEISEDNKRAQCAVTGKIESIARIHDKIEGLPRGLATGSVLIGFNNPSESSYGNEQSYNSNISEGIMRKYTKAMNYLLSSGNHKKIFDDFTVVHWAMSSKKEDDDIMSMLMFPEQNMDSREIEEMFSVMLKDAKQGRITSERIGAVTGIDTNVDYYMIGLKPNSSRIALKFIYRKKAADILLHIAQHQLDLQISETMKPIPFWALNKELLSPKSKNAKVNPELLTKIFYAAIYGTAYPQAMLSEVIRRIKTDVSSNLNTQEKNGKQQRIDPLNRTRVGMIKAYINRKSRILYQKEELKMSLDKENQNPAYLCGRLFAVLEKLQQDALGNNLNTTIRDSYFASATSKPAIVFPRLLKLAQSHLKKTSSAIFYQKLIGEVIDLLGNEFPDTLLLVDQGKFIIGYYHQYQSFFVKKDGKKNEEE